MSLEEDLKAIKEAEEQAEAKLAQAKKQAESLKSQAKQKARAEEKAALDRTREEMALRENALLDAAKKEGEAIIEKSKTTLENLQTRSAKNKAKASKFVVEEILRS